jgi:hypothetical protein
MKARSRRAVLALLLLASCSGPKDEPVPTPVSYGLFPNLIDYRPAYPPGTCMTEEEMLADQFIKLRTEIMITGLSCQASYQDPDLYTRYVDFTFEHQDRILTSQKVLGNLLGRVRRGRDDRLFDTFQTELANTESQNVTKVSTQRYCQARWEQFNTVLSYDEGEMAAYLQQAVEHYRDAYTACN